MIRRFSKQELFWLRNEIPLEWLIRDILRLPCQEHKGIFRFQCPCCRGVHTAVNRATNLARCFDCKRNFNAIDIVIASRRSSFVDTVAFLRQCSNKRAGQVISNSVTRCAPTQLADILSTMCRELVK
jgi:hypothetical protein